MEEWENNLPERPSKRAVEIAARCWCDEQTKSVEMDWRLALAFAKRLDNLLKALDSKSESGERNE